jgi:flagellar biosynthetic protein FliO
MARARCVDGLFMVGLLMAVLFFWCAGPTPAAAGEPFVASAESAPLALPDLSASWYKSYLSALAVLCFLLFAFFGALWLLRRLVRGGTRFMGVGSGPELHVESRLALGPKKWLMAVRYMDKRLLLGVTDHNVTLLTETPLEPGEDHVDSA